jgi:flagellar FliJ protein
MKRFQFSLNTVLSYKQQVLEELQNEHGQLLYQVRQQELVLQAAEERYRGLNLEFRQAETEGLTIAEALRYESGLRFLEDEIQREAKRLREYEAAAEEKRRQVVAARQDTASLEKLKDKKWEDYQKQVQKGEELLIEELAQALWTDQGGRLTFLDFADGAHRFSREVEHSDSNKAVLEEAVVRRPGFALRRLLAAVESDGRRVTAARKQWTIL